MGKPYEEFGNGRGGRFKRTAEVVVITAPLWVYFAWLGAKYLGI